MKKALLLMYVNTLDFFIRLSMFSDTTLKLRYASGFNKLRHFNGKARAYARFLSARKNVPAYREFLLNENFARVPFNGLVPDLAAVPVSNKKNYVSLFELSERCRHGRIPNGGVIIDESSGSSGLPTNWVRGKKERTNNHRLIQFGLKSLLGNEPVFIINAFALGAWATGMNITMSCLKFSKIKSTGPDALKIINTLKHFGPGHKYVIMGYPPFLKRLFDSAEVDWAQFNITLVFGGESMSEGMRDYLFKKGVKKVYSSFGASDLELNIASENDFTIGLRRLIRENAALKNELLKYDGALPMIFQFNPSDFWIETNQSGELIITICRPGYTSPKIRYNIYDKGHVMQLSELKTILKKHGLTDKVEFSETDLPVLFHYGRADMTVSFFGSNITPNDIQEVIFMMPQLAGNVNSFNIETIEDNRADKQLIVAIELSENVDADVFNKDVILPGEFFVNLTQINQDFKAAYAMAADNKPVLKFYAFNTGPFENADIRIKTKYISAS
jgi:phenylacetate-CoA ligase